MTVISTALAIVMFLASVAAHEAAHAFALRRYGVRIVEAGFGMPFKPRLVLPATKRRPWRFSVSPWIVCAYVEPDETQMHKIDGLGYRHQAWYAGAGIIANLVIGLVLLAVVAVAGKGNLILAACLTAAAVLLYVVRTYAVAYLFPVLALPVAALFVWSIAFSLGKAVGPVATVAELGSHSILDAVRLVGLMNIALAVLNMVPLYPFDGGRVFGLVVERFAGEKGVKRFQWVSSVVVLAFIAYSFGSDLFLL